MEFRPCIDIHNGQVKQIVGSSINDSSDSVKENFVAKNDSSYFATLYKEYNLRGGHVILLNSKESEYYEATKKEAFKALSTYPNGLQVGGGITDANAKEFIDAGASHVIVTSFGFNDGKICYDNLERLKNAVGKEHVVLDVSCRKNKALNDDNYYIVTNRWQTFTDAKVDDSLLLELSKYCDEFLVHAVDVEGKGSGIEKNVIEILKKSPIPVTYAGGISTLEDIEYIKETSDGLINITIGTALDIFGGNLKLTEVLACIQ